MITWDPPKRLANIAKHGYDFAGLTMEFFAAAVIRPAKRGRFAAFGEFRGRRIAVVFKPLGQEGISVISMRIANKRERP